MNTESFDLPGDKEQPSTGDGQNAIQDDVKISLPKIDRPEGPFEHSGETAGWTKEEAAEKKDQEK